MTIKNNLLLLWIFSAVLLMQVLYIDQLGSQHERSFHGCDTGNIVIFMSFAVTSFVVFLVGIISLLM